MNLQEQVKQIGDKVEALMGTVNVGTVSSVNRQKRTAQVILDDGENVSESMPIIRQGEPWLPQKGQTVAYLLRPGGDGIILGGIG